MTAKKYEALVLSLYDLIKLEFGRVLKLPEENLAMVYPKMVIISEFMSLLRGEAFSEIREPTPDFQEEMYRIEDEIRKLTDELASRLDRDDERTQYYLEQMKKSFSL